MIPESAFPLVQRYWPAFEDASKKHGPDPKLLLAMAWSLSALDAKTERNGARGLMGMSPATAEDVARRLDRKTWDLFDPSTAVDLGAAYLAAQLERFLTISVALAAYYAGPGTVAKAGGQVPPVRSVERFVRDVTATWSWLRAHLMDVLARPVDTEPKQWRVIAPADNWRSPIKVPATAVPLLAELANRLGLAFNRDEKLRKLYVDVPRPKSEPPVAGGQLLLPVPGATKANNGAYESDSGIDIMVPVGTPVVAAASGTILYSEWGHTRFNKWPDTPGSILIALDRPFEHKRKKYPFIWYTHLSWLRYDVPDGSRGRHVDQGEQIGRVGRGRNIPHLHFGVVVDRAQTDWVHPFQLAAYFGWTGGGSR